MAAAQKSDKTTIISNKKFFCLAKVDRVVTKFNQLYKEQHSNPVKCSLEADQKKFIRVELLLPS